MLEKFDSQPIFDVLDSEYVRLLGYPPHRKLDGRAKELADQTREWFAQNGKPWIYLRELASLEISETGIVANGATFTSERIREQYTEAEAEIAVVAAISAGKECEEYANELWKSGKPDEYFFMEMYGSAVVESLVTRAGANLCEWADPQGIAILPHYSPGYPEWDISEQVAFLQLIKSGTNGTKPGYIQSLDTGMLKPKKSLLALFGGTRRLDKAKNIATLIPCENCSLVGCAYRRAPYYLDTIEEMDSVEDRRTTARKPAPLLDQDASYSVHRKALRKWSDARLQMSELPDGSTEARFLYEGTTCSNMGHPLQYEYRIKIGTAESNYRVLEANCSPVKDHEGYKKMCEYLKVGEALNQTISDERPLLGEPLETVLDWNHHSSSSGCYCDLGGRNHKWGLAYEVIHFAMAQAQAADMQEAQTKAS